MTPLGKYELHEELGRGGFGTVYRATDTALQREVALKVLHPQLTTDPDFLEKFRAEARMVANLNSHHIVTIYDLDEAEGRIFIAMQYMHGGSLKQRLEKDGKISYDETLRIMHQVCTGLAAAHKKGLIHRDLKPGNILFDEDGNAVLGDFGLAKAIQNSSISAASSAGAVGTPAYRAPELWLGKPPVSPATDIYSLGCVLAEMLTGKALFDGDSTDVVITQHLVTGPAIPTGLPQNIQDALAIALAKDAQQRYQSTTEVITALGQTAVEPALEMPNDAAINILDEDETQPKVIEQPPDTAQSQSASADRPIQPAAELISQEGKNVPEADNSGKKDYSWLKSIAIHYGLLFPISIFIYFFVILLVNSFFGETRLVADEQNVVSLVITPLEVVILSISFVLYGLMYGCIFAFSLKPLIKLKLSQYVLMSLGYGFLFAFTPIYFNFIGVEEKYFILTTFLLSVITGSMLFIWHIKEKRSPRTNIYIFFAIWAIGLILFLLRADQNGILLLLSQFFYGAYAVSDALDMAVGLSSRAKTAIVVSHLLSLFFPSIPFITTLIVLYRKKKRTLDNARMGES